MQRTEFRLDERSGIPVYLQLRDQILHAIARGTLRGGDRLPTVREVAVALAVNPNTVNRAYLELEREGVLAAQRGRGTFVAERARGEARPHKVKLAEAAERFVAQARALGFDGAEIERAVAAQIKRQVALARSAGVLQGAK
ncbi:MAG TPA: GntR family transcriptional regulator [Verrucomicrobiae bacterium]|nr:GntR family transcriptional regulator [Verrucomicrobiae bacterium]